MYPQSSTMAGNPINVSPNHQLGRETQLMYPQSSTTRAGNPINVSPKSQSSTRAETPINMINVSPNHQLRRETQCDVYLFFVSVQIIHMFQQQFSNKKIPFGFYF